MHRDDDGDDSIADDCSYDRMVTCKIVDDDDDDGDCNRANDDHKNLRMTWMIVMDVAIRKMMAEMITMTIMSEDYEGDWNSAYGDDKDLWWE